MTGKFKPLKNKEIRLAIERCPRLPSLKSVNKSLHEVFRSDTHFTAQIADIIRRDPALASRLLKLVNSVFFGLNQKIYTIEDAIFYLGLRQVRELAMATPILEDFAALNPAIKCVDWNFLWQHSIGTAVLTRELLAASGEFFNDEMDYLVGLLHHVGKLVMAFVFPDRFETLARLSAHNTVDFCKLERGLIGWDHAAIGAHFLEQHNLSEVMTDSIRHHHNPEKAINPKIAAAIQVADHMLRATGIASIEKVDQPEIGSWKALSGWAILFPDATTPALFELSLDHTLVRLFKTLCGFPV